MTRPVTLLDASVLYPSLVRNLLMHLAVGGLIAARWSEDIHGEWTRHLAANHPDLSPGRIGRTRELMQAAVPDALVTGYEELIGGLSLPDPDDRHVLAAAIEAEAELIVTFNLRHFPQAALEPYGLEALTPDELVVRLLDEDPHGTRAALQGLRLSFSKPAYDVPAFLERLRVVGLPQAAERWEG